MTQHKKRYIKNTLTNDPKNTGLKVGDLVEWVNDYGVVWQHKVIGFNYVNDYNHKYKCYVHLDTDSYWFPHNHKEMKVINKQK